RVVDRTSEVDEKLYSLLLRTESVIATSLSDAQLWAKNIIDVKTAETITITAPRRASIEFFNVKIFFKKIVLNL
ncbi:TPA: hypothetical protein ACSPZB_004802, partial [Citrobacter freundii]